VSSDRKKSKRKKKGAGGGGSVGTVIEREPEWNPRGPGTATQKQKGGKISGGKLIKKNRESGKGGENSTNKKMQGYLKKKVGKKGGGKFGKRGGKTL